VHAALSYSCLLSSSRVRDITVEQGHTGAKSRGDKYTMQPLCGIKMVGAILKSEEPRPRASVEEQVTIIRLD
jgi:hypothetical protein